METKEKEFTGVMVPGFFALFVMAIILIGGTVLLASQRLLALFFPLLIIELLFLFGFFIIEPNNGRVMIFFGKYTGTIKRNGFFWANPFYEKKKVTLRARNLDVPPIKVNDKVGNPVMIGLVLVWRIKDSYKVTFDIDTSATNVQASATNVQASAINVQLATAAGLSRRMEAYENFVKIQSDSALRWVAGQYAYDNQENKEDTTLRSGDQEITERLERELNTRLAIAGIEVVEARINYLAYAPEIASVMLRRQQADAIISAREKIVEGAVTMVEIALNKLKADGVVDLDNDKKAAMVSNLLVVLCADEQVQPVVNTGSLYQ